MDRQNGHEESCITAEYEERVLRDFRIWYRENQPTIAAANEQATLIASDTVKRLTMIQVVILLREHPEWTHRPLLLGGNEQEITVSGVVRAHLMQHLEQTIQSKGLKTVYMTS